MNPVVCAGGTDARFVRAQGIPSLGFSPINKTQLLLHHHNEYLNCIIFLKGIEIYIEVFKKVANVVAMS